MLHISQTLSCRSLYPEPSKTQKNKASRKAYSFYPKDKERDSLAKQKHLWTITAILQSDPTERNCVPPNHQRPNKEPRFLLTPKYKKALKHPYVLHPGWYQRRLSEELGFLSSSFLPWQCWKRPYMEPGLLPTLRRYLSFPYWMVSEEA